MNRHGLGLVVGKFAPLHLGHEALIGAAAATCERLLLLSYSVPEPDGCSPTRRERWLRSRFPEHDVAVLDDARLRACCAARACAVRPIPPNDAEGPDHWAFLAWLLRDALARPVDAMFANEAYIEPCAAALTAALGRPVAAVSFDVPRRAVPVSGRWLREDPWGRRRWLAPVVAADFDPQRVNTPSAPAAPAAPA